MAHVSSAPTKRRRLAAATRKPKSRPRTARPTPDAGGSKSSTPRRTAPTLLAADGLPATVGIRELRQNLSIYLDRVKQGIALQVTEHGRVVAVLTPLPPSASRYDILLAQGLITPATRSIRDLPPPRKMPPGSRPMSEILDELREDRI